MSRKQRILTNNTLAAQIEKTAQIRAAELAKQVTEDEIQKRVYNEFNRKLEMSTTWVLAAVVNAMDRAHCRVNWDKWFRYFAEIYPDLLKDPETYVKAAEKIVGADIEIHWE